MVVSADGRHARPGGANRGGPRLAVLSSEAWYATGARVGDTEPSAADYEGCFFCSEERIGIYDPARDIWVAPHGRPEFPDLLYPLTSVP